jgi:hypothetical protein
MKKLIELGNLQANLMKDIMSDEHTYNHKRVIKFSVVSEVDEISGNAKHYLCANGNLDTHYYGQLIYMLGMKVQKEFAKG